MFKSNGDDYVKRLKILVLTLFCMVGLFGCKQITDEMSNSSPFGNGDATVFAPHREDFSSVIEESVLEQFETDSEVKKAYILRINDWFLSEDISDFSQAVTTDSVYVIPGGEDGTDAERAYSFYKVNEENAIEWNGSAYPPSDATLPFGFSGLTYEVIDEVLNDVEYEDYIITYAQRLNTVFVWVRCENEDLIITYPTCPDLLGIEVGGLYTVDEVKGILAEAYSK